MTTQTIAAKISAPISAEQAEALARLDAEAAAAGPTEYDRKQEALAGFLYRLSYDLTEFDRDERVTDESLRANYLADAADVLRDMPHLLSLGENERLAELAALTV